MKTWLPTTLAIACIFAFRMLGLFMLIPIFSIYGQQLSGANSILIGLTLGAYGCSQGLMQIPFGILSDYWGRKPLLYLGLSLFLIGSIMGIYAHSIYTMLFARIMQGFGAIGAVLIAFMGDTIPETDRPKAMAIIGMSIACSFALAMILSPLIASHQGLSGIFKITALMAIFGLLITTTLTQKPSSVQPQSFKTKFFWNSLSQPNLLTCHLGIFIQHFILTASFFAIPLQLKSAQIQSTQFYLVLMLASFACMMPLITRYKKNLLVKICFSSLCLGQLLLAFSAQNIMLLWIAAFIYFLSFNILEALLPVMLTTAAQQNFKGTASGIYSSSQFLGIFMGGLCAGFTYKLCGIQGIFFCNSLIALGYTLLSQKYLNPVVNVSVEIK